MSGDIKLIIGLSQTTERLRIPEDEADLGVVVVTAYVEPLAEPVVLQEQPVVSFSATAVFPC